MQAQSLTVATMRAPDCRKSLGDTIFSQPPLSMRGSEEQRHHAYNLSADRKHATSNPTAGGQHPQHTERRKTNVSGVEAGDLVINQDQLYAEFRPLVRRLIRQYGENAEIRNDLEGEIYYRFCVLLEVYDPNRGVPLRPYLVRQLSAAIYTFARQNWRSQHREVSLELFTSDSGPKHSIDPTPDWDDALDLQQFKDLLPAAIAKLSARQRKVLILRYYEDTSFEEIATQLEIKPATVRSLLRHALNHLRADMAPSK